MKSDESTQPESSVMPQEVLGVATLLSRALWFALGVCLGVGATMLAMRTRREPVSTPVSRGYEALPITDNSGVCQEYVALASLRTSYADAAATARRIAPSLVAPLRAEHVRVVRAPAQGEHWTLAIDGQPGAGTLEIAQAHAQLANGIAGTGLRWSAIFYGARELFESAGVLCMPRQGAGH
ncbi:MAG: hypothetical protein Q8Q09_15585 [Deltaproteobacteria bacterium]|nr:hypothetical protein [Deltaproteobacteria bacterium]